MNLALLVSTLALFGAQDPAVQTPAGEAAAAPAPAATAQPAETAAEAARLDQVVCRTEAVVGTRFDSRVCMTRRQWNERRDESRRLAHRMESNNANRGRITAPGH